MKRWLIAIFAAMLGAAAALAIASARLHWCEDSLPFDLRHEWRCNNWNDETLEATRVAGNAIVVALTAFRNRGGAFPASLDELISPDLEAIPPPAAGTGGWIYETDEMRCCFRLGVSGYRDCSCLLFNVAREGEWRVHEAGK